MQQIIRDRQTDRHNTQCAAAAAAAAIGSPCISGNFSATSAWRVGLYDLYRRFSTHIFIVCASGLLEWQDTLKNEATLSV